MQWIFCRGDLLGMCVLCVKSHMYGVEPNSQFHGRSIYHEFKHPALKKRLTPSWFFISFCQFCFIWAFSKVFLAFIWKQYCLYTSFITAAMLSVSLGLSLLTNWWMQKTEIFRELWARSWLRPFRCSAKRIYTVSHKKTRHIYFCDNSGKYWPIFVIFSLLYPSRNCGIRTC